LKNILIITLLAFALAATGQYLFAGFFFAVSVLFFLFSCSYELYKNRKEPVDKKLIGIPEKKQEQKPLKSAGQPEQNPNITLAERIQMNRIMRLANFYGYNQVKKIPDELKLN
jgi:hypothetical protein